MKYLFSCLVFLVSFMPSGRAQSDDLQQAMDQFQMHFNAREMAAIYGMMSPSFQEAIAEDALVDVLQKYYASYGYLKSLSLKQSNGNSGVFEGAFEKGYQDMAVQLNDQKLISAFRFIPSSRVKEVKIARNSTPLQFPLKGEWRVVWGGDTKAKNYHVVSQVQKHAFDLWIVKNKKIFERSGTRNEDYYAFGQPMYAVCDAVVETVITGVPDNKPGEMNPKIATGNTVILKTEADEYIVYAHFEQGTIVVKEGQMVKKGQYLGNCGNSGNSSAPHLHLHIQDGPDLMNSVGVKCYFESLLVNGELKKDYSPVQTEVISRPND